MESVRNILIQLDSDPQASSFDSVVAVDAGADVLLRHANVTPDQVTSLTHGAMFTRSSRKLKHTAIFVGGSDADLAEKNYQKVITAFFGPVQVSVAMDANGCNTTSVAAVRSAMSGLRTLKLLPEVQVTTGNSPLDSESATNPAPALDPVLDRLTATVLGGTGAVGRRVCRLLAQAGFRVLVNSRTIQKAQKVIDEVKYLVPSAEMEPAIFDSENKLVETLTNSQLIMNAGAAGIPYVSDAAFDVLKSTAGVLVDLNAVPPAGISGVGVTDDAVANGSRLCFGALAVGGFKMKLHRSMIAACFTSNEHRFNLEEIFDLANKLE